MVAEEIVWKWHLPAKWYFFSLEDKKIYQRQWKISSVFLCCSLPWDRLLQWTKLTILARSADQKTLQICPFPPSKSGIIETNSHVQLFVGGYWGFELRSSCLENKFSYPLNHVPLLSPLFLYAQKTFSSRLSPNNHLESLFKKYF